MRDSQPWNYFFEFLNCLMFPRVHTQKCWDIFFSIKNVGMPLWALMQFRCQDRVCIRNMRADNSCNFDAVQMHGLKFCHGNYGKLQKLRSLGNWWCYSDVLVTWKSSDLVLVSNSWVVPVQIIKGTILSNHKVHVVSAYRCRHYSIKPQSSISLLCANN
jgi:hypothetical protein